MKQIEITYLIEDAEQGSDLQTIESGKAARVELDNINKQLAALREAGEKMARALQDVLHDRPSAHTDNVWENVNTALEAWEAANK